mgnify:CR=1 FL=1
MNCIEHYGYYENVADFPEHSHTSCEILYLHEGRIKLTADGESYELTGGMLYLMPSSTVHKNELLDRSVYRRTLMFLNPWIYGRSFHDNTVQNLLMGFISKKPAVLTDDFGALAMINDIGRELDDDPPLSQAVTAAIVTKLIASIIRKTGMPGSSEDAPVKMVIDVCNYIQDHCTEQLRISDISDKFYISKYYLTHIFKEQMGVSPRQFLSTARLSKAYSMLYDKSIKISEISDMCCFTSHSDFAKKFKEQYGTSPTDFRKKLFDDK